MRPRCASPSMVSTLWPAAAETGTEQERTGSPFRCTVHAPHWAMPQPNLGPFTSSTSRNTQSKGISGSTSALRFLPLTESSIIWDLLVCDAESRESLGIEVCAVYLIKRAADPGP